MSLPVISTSFSLTTEGAEFLGHQGCNSVVNLAQNLIFLVYLFVLLFVQCKKSSSLANFTHTHSLRLSIQFIPRKFLRTQPLPVSPKGFARHLVLGHTTNLTDTAASSIISSTG